MSAPRAIVAGCVLALALVSSAAAAVTPFGANLGAIVPNNDPSATCAHAPPGLLYPVNSVSCMWSYSNSSTNSLVPPASGTVTAVRVKVGTTTGKMRVNVIRFLFQQTGDPAHPSSAGPFLEAYGPEFTPAANAVTTVPTNLALQEDSTPPLNDTSTIQVIDALALEVESSTVPIPIFYDGSSLSYPTYPGPTAGGVPAPSPAGIPGSSLSFGYGVAMNADLTTADGTPAPIPTPIPTPTLPGPTTPALPTVALPRTTIPVRHNVAGVPIQCQGADCAGLVSLLRATGARGAAARKATSYGSARFTAKAGTTATVKVKLNKAGRALLKHKRRAKVTARVTFTAGGGAAKTFRVTLKR